jgi:hypothetical protein
VQGEEDLPGRELGRELVPGMYRERGLANPGHPADRVNAHHATRAGQGVGQLLQLQLPPGERTEVTGQRPGGHRGRRAHPGLLRHVPTSRGRLELGSDRPCQAQPVSQQPGRVLASCQVDAALKVTDRPHAHPRRVGQFLLGQSGISTEPSQ